MIEEEPFGMKPKGVLLSVRPFEVTKRFFGLP